MVGLDTESLADTVSIAYKSGKTSGTLDIRLRIDGDTIHTDIVKEAAADGHTGVTQRGQFLNELKNKVGNADTDVSADVVRALVADWFDKLMAGEAEVSEELRGEIESEIIEGTSVPVEIHGASDNNTTYNVTLEFRGQKNTIKFDADSMIPGSGPAALQSVLAHQFYQPIEVPDSDWEGIREHWADNSELVNVTETTPEKDKADRVLEFLGDSLEPTADKDKLGNSPRTAYVQPDPDAEQVDVDADCSLVWIQERHYSDEIESVASIDAKRTICIEMRERDVLKHKTRLHWRPDTNGKDRFWAFKAEAVGIDAGDFEETGEIGGRWDLMAEIIKIDGSPGAGKSYMLEKRLEVEKDNGVGVFDFWWLNFTTSGRKDVEPVLDDMFAPPTVDTEPSDRAKTVHGLALSLCIRENVIDADTLDKQLIMQGRAGDDETDHFAMFCEQRAIPYSPDTTGSRSILAGESEGETTGNKLFAINDYLRQTVKGPSAYREAPTDVRIGGEGVKRLLKEWDAYKREQEPRLYEHGDYVKEAIDHNLVPDVDVLLMDEFQDLAPLEYKLYKMWRDSGQMRRIYISGDSNQSVYSFRGGTPKYFDGTPADDVITLKESYRCPETVSQVGHELLAAHERTDPRGFGGKDDGGEVRTRSYTDKNELRDRVLSLAGDADVTPAVMLLTRTNRQKSKLANDLRKAGVPFKTLGSNGGAWNTGMRRVYAVLSVFGEVDEYNRTSVQELFKRLPDGTRRRVDMQATAGREVPAEAVHDVFTDHDGPLSILDELEFSRSTSWRRDVLRNALDAPGNLSPDTVQVGTIHTSKGLEAPEVLLFTNVSKSMTRRYRRRKNHAAEEHRVYYVGATRASERLTLVEDYFGGPVAEPIKRIAGTGVLA